MICAFFYSQVSAFVTPEIGATANLNGARLRVATFHLKASLEVDCVTREIVHRGAVHTLLFGYLGDINE